MEMTPAVVTACVGKPAPDFTLEGYSPEGKIQNYSLKDYRGKWVLFFFYPLDFTFVCPTEITEFSNRYAEFEKIGATVLGASTDSTHSHKAWCESKLGTLNYPLLADLNHEVSRAYGSLIEGKGHTLRSTFVIDPEGQLRYALHHDNNIGRSVDECLRVISALQTGELCPASWTPGKPTLGKA